MDITWPWAATWITDTIMQTPAATGSLDIHMTFSGKTGHRHPHGPWLQEKYGKHHSPWWQEGPQTSTWPQVARWTTDINMTSMGSLEPEDLSRSSNPEKKNHSPSLTSCHCSESGRSCNWSACWENITQEMRRVSMIISSSNIRKMNLDIFQSY